MRKLAAGNPWVAALLSWFLATALVGAIYTLWRTSQGAAVRWTDLRDAALIVGPIALFRAWRDSRRRE